ncbi:hypothetical protein [Zhihengliuella salsuginis]|nr:hypothetical protein [Zhihengliuella salsuginis]
MRGTTIRLTSTALAASVALSIAGCGSGDADIMPTAPATSAVGPAATPAAGTSRSPAVDAPTPEASGPGEPADPGQAWADARINLFLGGQGAHSFDAFMEGTRHREIKSWGTPEPGVLGVVVASGEWSGEDLTWLATDFMLHGGQETPELEEVVVSVEGAATVGRATRSDVPGLD